MGTSLFFNKQKRKTAVCLHSLTECPATCVRHLTWLLLQYPRGREQCISYMNTDPECLMFIFRTKLIKINIENLNGFALVINWSAEFLTQLTDGKDTPWTVDVSSFLLLKHASQVALVVNNPPANVGDIRDVGSVPGLGRSPDRGRDNPLQYSCLENSMDRGAWRATIHGIARVGYDWSDFSSVQLLSHVQLFVTPWTAMPGLPVHHQLLEFTQTRVHWVGDAIQPSHPLSSPSPPALSLSQHQGHTNTHTHTYMHG